MRFLNWFYAKPGKGFEPADLPRVFSSVCECDFSEFFESYVSGMDTLPYEEYLALAGLELLRGEKTATDFGFEATSNHGEPPIVARIDEGSAAAEAGLQLGDVVLSQYRRAEAGEELSLKVLRGGEEHEVNFLTGEKQVPHHPNQKPRGSKSGPAPSPKGIGWRGSGALRCSEQ